MELAEHIEQIYLFIVVSGALTLSLNIPLIALGIAKHKQDDRSG